MSGTERLNTAIAGPRSAENGSIATYACANRSATESMQ